MNTKSLKTLEYNKIIAQLETYASSPLGRDLCRNLVPSIDVHEIRQMQKETSDALTRVRQRQHFLYGAEGCRGIFKTPGDRQLFKYHGITGHQLHADHRCQSQGLWPSRGR